MEISPITYGDIIVILISIGFGFITYKLWQERNDSPNSEQKGSRLLLIVISLVFAAISLGLFFFAIIYMLDPMKYSVEEHSSNTKILGNVHNWAWSLLFLSGSFMIGYLTSMFFKIWKIWNKTRNETIVKTSSESNKKLDKIKNPNAFASNFKEKNEDHQKYMPK